MVVAKAGYLIPGPLREQLRRAHAAAPVEPAGRCRKPQASAGWVWVGERIGVTERRVRVLAGQLPPPKGTTGLVRVETADAVLTGLGTPIGEVYGPMYGLPVPEWDGCGEKCSRCRLSLREPAPLCGFCIEEGAQP